MFCWEGVGDVFLERSEDPVFSEYLKILLGDAKEKKFKKDGDTLRQSTF